MARFVQQNCGACRAMTTHMVIGSGSEGWMVQCEDCARLANRPVAKVSKRKTTYPYYNGSAGTTFESESHEQKFAKVHKLEKI